MGERKASGFVFAVNVYIDTGRHGTWRMAGKPLIHKGRKP